MVVNTFILLLPQVLLLLLLLSLLRLGGLCRRSRSGLVGVWLKRIVSFFIHPLRKFVKTLHTQFYTSTTAHLPNTYKPNPEPSSPFYPPTSFGPRQSISYCLHSRRNDMIQLIFIIPDADVGHFPPPFFSLLPPS